MFSLLLSALSFLPMGADAAASSDTILVSDLLTTTPVAVRMPYLTDSLSLSGKAFNIESILDKNANLAALPDSHFHKYDGGAGEGAKNQLAAWRVAVNTDRFTVLNLNIDFPGKYRLFVDGKRQEGNRLQLAPGRARITVLTLADSVARPTIRLIGENLSSVSCGTADKQPYTMATMLQGEHYRDVSLSPSGDYLLTHCYNTHADGTNTFTTVVTQTVSGRQQLYRDGFQRFAWWPHRDVLYYTQKGEGGYDLYTLDVKTGQVALKASGLPADNISLSPTGSYAIVSQSIEGGEEYSKGLKRLIHPDDRQPGWRYRSALWRYDFDSHTMYPLTYGNTTAHLSDISADGRRLLLIASREEVAKSPFTRTTVVELDATTGAVDTIFADTTYIAGVSYSPDGSQLLVKASPGAFGGIGLEVAEGQIPNAFDYKLYLYDLKSRRVQPLLRGFKPAVGRSVWVEGDNNIYFRATEGCDETLFRVNPRSGALTRYALPVSYVQDFTISTERRTPRAVVFGQTGERAREMYLATLDKAQPAAQRIGAIDFDSLTADVAIGACRDWSFRSSRGDTISGFYFLPPHFDATRSYPLIVYYYGGCTPTAKTLEFQYSLQVLAGQGYVVYVCEPSGAIGYGQEFAARHVGTWGQGSADDIIEGTRAFIAEHAYVDSTRVGCMGASYGGFMTQYLQTRTDLFAAAISHAGISNIASYWGGGYWGYSYGEAAQMGSYPWNNAALYVEQSPLFNADKIHTPLLLLHGTADTNVPTNESQQLYTALRILHRPVSYVQVDGENHVISDYHKRLAWQNAIFAWFAKWLKNEPLWWTTLFPGDNCGMEE